MVKVQLIHHIFTTRQSAFECQYQSISARMEPIPPTLGEKMQLTLLLFARGQFSKGVIRSARPKPNLVQPIFQWKTVVSTVV